MAQIRVSFTSALVALSLAVCLIVALAFVDRSRRDERESSPVQPQANSALQPVSRAQSFVQSSAFTEPLEKPEARIGNTGENPPQLSWQGDSVPGQPPAASVQERDSGAELPLDPRLRAAVTNPVPSDHSASKRPNPAQIAALAPEELAKRYQGKVAVPLVSQAGAPALAVPPGMQYAQPTPSAVAVPRMTPVPGPLPIMTNSGGVDHALENLGVGSVAGISTAPGDPALPFSHPGTISTDRLRAALAENSGMVPSSLLPQQESASSLGPSTNAGGAGWDPVQHGSRTTAQAAATTPNSMIMIKGGKPQAQYSGPAGSTAANASPNGSFPVQLSAMPEDSAAILNDILTNDPTTSIPNSAISGVGSGPVQTENQWNLPPPPSLQAPAIQSAAQLDPSKLTPRPDLAQGTAAEKSRTPMLLPPNENSPASVPDVPLEVAEKLGAGDVVIAARVDERTLSAREAAQRADALGFLQGRELDDDHRRMLARTAAEAWTEMVAVAEEARRKGITVTPAEYPDLLKKRELDPMQLEEALRKAGLTPSEIESELRDLCLGEKLVNSTIAEKFDDQKLRSLYEENSEKFRMPRRLHIQEIFKARPTDAAEVKQVERDMDKLHQQARSGADFSLLASQVSEAPSKAKGGDLGWIDDQSDITEEMAKALLPLKPGQVSDVVSGPAGYHIYRLVDLQEPVPGFEGARDRVIMSLRDGIRESLQRSSLAKADVELSHKTKKSRVASAKNTRDRDAEVAKVLKTSTKAKPQAKSKAEPVEQKKQEREDALGQVAQPPAVDSGAVPGFGPADSRVMPPTPATVSNQASSGPRGAVQSFFSRFRRPSPTIQQ